MAIGIDQYTKLNLHGNVESDFSNDVNTTLLIPFERENGFVNDVNTILLIKCDGVDGENDFIDESGYSHTIDPNGNVQIDNGVEPPFGTGAALFDGTNDYLEVLNNAVFEFTGNFTIESWVRFATTTVTQNIFAHSTDVNNRMNIVVSTTAARLLVTVGGVDVIDANWASLGLSANVWYHFALVRNGSNFDLYVDGIQRSSTVVDASPIPAFTGNIIIGESNAFGNDFNGRLDEYRISNVARYTATFYPASKFKDYSSNAIPTKTTGATDHYRTDVAFGRYSANFQSGSYLTMADNAIFQFGSTFTIEFWVHWTSSALQPFYHQYENINRRAHFAVSPTTAQLDVRYGGTLLSNTWTLLGMVVGTKWYHIALVRNGNNFDLYIDGIKNGSTYVDADAWPDIAGDVSIGNTFSVPGLSALNSRVDNYRISNTARYTSNFTPKLLIPDSSTDNTKIPVVYGNCHVDDRVAKFSTGSIRFDGATDYILVPDSDDWFFTGDFTIDCWIRLVSTSTQILLGQYVDASNYWLVRISGADIRFTFVSVGITIIDTLFTTGETLNTNVFKHLAIVRTGNDYKCFINGVQKGSTQTDSSSHVNFATNLTIGVMTGFTSLNSWVDELRISTTARWTSNFTPPDSEYTPKIFTVAACDEFEIEAFYITAVCDEFEIEGSVREVAVCDEFEIDNFSKVAVCDEFEVAGNVRIVAVCDEFEIFAVYHATSRSSTPPGIRRSYKGGQHRTDDSFKLKRGYGE